MPVVTRESCVEYFLVIALQHVDRLHAPTVLSWQPVHGKRFVDVLFDSVKNLKQPASSPHRWVQPLSSLRASTRSLQLNSRFGSWRQADQSGGSHEPPRFTENALRNFAIALSATPWLSPVSQAVGLIG